MNRYQPGDRAKLMKGTFLHRGIIVRNGSPVTVLAAHADGRYDVEYRDAENQPHCMEGVGEAELAPPS